MNDLMFEDQLPDGMTDAEYAEWFRASSIVGGVRMGPIFGMAEPIVPTTVVSVRGKKREEMERDPSFLYVGRNVKFTTWTERSPWANPFWVGISPEKAANILRAVGAPFGSLRSPVEMYERWLRHRPDLMARLPELRSRRLGCWCGTFSGVGDPGFECHALILAGLADGTIKAEG